MTDKRCVGGAALLSPDRAEIADLERTTMKTESRSRAQMALAMLTLPALFACGATHTPPAEYAASSDDARIQVIAPEDVCVGTPDLVTFVLTPAGELKLTDGFPASLEVGADGSAEPTLRLRAQDAQENTEERLVFERHFTAAAPGTQRFLGTFSFSVCSPTSCTPATLAFEWSSEAAECPVSAAATIAGR